MKVIMTQNHYENDKHLMQVLQHEGFSCSLVPKNGKKVLEAISQRPDLVIMDCCMPYLDSIGVLKTLQAQHMFKPFIIVTTYIDNEALMQELTYYGADYILLRPFDVNTAFHMVRHFFGRSVSLGGTPSAPIRNFSNTPTSMAPAQPANPKMLVSNYLKDLGTPYKLSGYAQLCDAICLCIENPKYSESITKVLYPEIAKKFHKTSLCIEHTLRYVIDRTWSKGNPQVIAQYFGDKMHVTNKEFILASVQIIKQQLNLVQTAERSSI